MKLNVLPPAAVTFVAAVQDTAPAAIESLKQFMEEFPKGNVGIQDIDHECDLQVRFDADHHVVYILTVDLNGLVSVRALKKTKGTSPDLVARS